MNRLATAKQMKEIDNESINKLCIPSIALMEVAGRSVFEEINKRFDKNKKILIITGSGNNGADALVCAKYLEINGYTVHIHICPNSNHSNEFDMQLNIIKNMRISFKIGGIIDTEFINNYDIVLDGIFGIGLNKEIKCEYKLLIDAINTSNSFIISVDVPSGINSSNGSIHGCAIKADITITFGVNKVGLMILPGAEYAGEIIVKDIGFPKNIIEKYADEYFYLENNSVNLPNNKKFSHKGENGKILVIAGNKDVFGAVFFTAKAAYKAGAGLVYIYTHISNKSMLNILLPEALVITYEEVIDIKELSSLIDKCDSCVIGPGIGISNTSKKLLDIVLSNNILTVLDADAINLLDKDSIERININKVVLTPHILEFYRLYDKTMEDKSESNLDNLILFYNKYNIKMILKDARSIVIDNNKKYINITGSEALAKGGSGDILSGIIATYLLRYDDLFDVLMYSSYLHGIIATNISTKIDATNVLAQDILNYWGIYE